MVWQLDTEKRKYLPRIGSPLLYFTDSPDPLLASVSRSFISTTKYIPPQILLALLFKTEISFSGILCRQSNSFTENAFHGNLEVHIWDQGLFQQSFYELSFLLMGPSLIFYHVCGLERMRLSELELWAMPPSYHGDMFWRMVYN